MIIVEYADYSNDCEKMTTQEVVEAVQDIQTYDNVYEYFD